MWPLHALTLLVAVLLGERAGAGATVANALLLHAWVPDPSWYFGLNGVSWSLSCEAFFYASFPVLVVLLSRTRSWHWLLVPPTLSAIVLLGSTRLSDGTATWLLYLSPPYRMLDFVMGILLALLVRRGAAPRVRLDVALGLLVVGPLLLVATGRGITRELYGSPIIGLYDLAVLPGVCALLLAAAGLDAARTPGWLNRRPLVWLGECSFALYMTHQLVFSTVSRTLDNRPAAGLLGLLLVVPVSALAHHLVERPLERRWRVQKTPGSQRGDAARTAASTVDGPDDSGHETGGPGAMVRR